MQVKFGKERGNELARGTSHANDRSRIQQISSGNIWSNGLNGGRCSSCSIIPLSNLGSPILGSGGRSATNRNDGTEGIPPVHSWNLAD